MLRNRRWFFALSCLLFLSVLGSGFLERVYHEAFAAELGTQGVPHDREVLMPVYYKGVRLDLGYRVDFVCYGEVLVEVKAIDRLTGREEAQVINYLMASRLGRGLLLNFGSPCLQFKRFAGPLRAPTAPSVSSVQSVGGSS